MTIWTFFFKLRMVRMAILVPLDGQGAWIPEMMDLVGVANAISGSSVLLLNFCFRVASSNCILEKLEYILLYVAASLVVRSNVG